VYCDAPKSTVKRTYLGSRAKAAFCNFRSETGLSQSNSSTMVNVADLYDLPRPARSLCHCYRDTIVELGVMRLCSGLLSRTKPPFAAPGFSLDSKGLGISILPSLGHLSTLSIATCAGRGDAVCGHAK
jgi:hypothetical protein